MNIELLYFGRPRERLQRSRETLVVPDNLTTLDALLSWLRERGGEWEAALAHDRVRCAINQRHCEIRDTIRDHDEIAIFSPISGG